MGTYTTNYNLFMPTVGETGWGTLVNGNFSTIDTTMKGLDTRLTTVESEVNGNLSCTSVTTSGKVTANGGVGTTSLTTSSTITSTGQIVANGGMKLANGILYIPHNTTGGVLFFNANADLTMSANQSKSFTFRVPNGNIRPVATSFTINLKGRIGMTGSSNYYGTYTVTENGTTIKSGNITTSSETSLGSFTAKIGNTYVVTASAGEKVLYCYVRGAIYF